MGKSKKAPLLFLSLALILPIGGIFSVPALASQENVICAGGNAQTMVRFIFPLITGDESVNENRVIPFFSRDIILMYGPVGQQQKVNFDSDDMIGLWLDDGRMDTRFYREEKNEDGRLIAFDLIVRTMETGEAGTGSRGMPYRGDFLFRAFDGPLRGGEGDMVQEIRGEAVCSQARS